MNYFSFVVFFASIAEPAILSAQSEVKPKLCKANIVAYGPFGEPATDARFALENSRGNLITNLAEPVPCGTYRLKGNQVYGTIVDRAVEIGRPVTTVLVGVGGYYGDRTVGPTLELSVTGIPKGVQAIARVFSAFGDFSKETAVNQHGKAQFDYLQPGYYLIAILAEYGVLCEGVARVGHPLHGDPLVKLKVNRGSYHKSFD